MRRPGKWELVLLVGILLLATVLRVAWPTLSEFKFSEARLEALALELTREGRLPLVGVPSSAGFDHSPLSVYLYVPAFLFTTDPVPATVYGGLVGVAAVALCWWLARRWPGGGHRAAAVAALLFAASPWAVAFSRKIWQVAFVPFLTLVCIGLVISALIEGSAEGLSKRRQWRLAWAIAGYAVLVQIHPSAVSLAPALLIWLLVFRKRVRLGPLLAGVLLGGLTALPFMVHQIQSGWPALSALRSLPSASWDLTAVQLAWEAITGRSIHSLAGDAYPLLKTVPQLGWVFNVIGWLVVGASLALPWRMVKNWRADEPDKQQGAQVDFVLLTWLVVPVVFNLRQTLPLHLHFFALSSPAAFLIAGRAAELVFGVQPEETRELAHVGPWPRIAKIVGATLLGLLVVGQVVVLAQVARFVAAHDTPGGFGTPLARYQGIAAQMVEAAEQVGAAEVLVVGQGDSIVVHQTPAIFDVLLRDKLDYRFVNGESAAVFPPHKTTVLLVPELGEAAKWYEGWPTMELADGYRIVALDGSWPDHDLSPVASPRVFQSGVEFQGYAWESEEVEQAGQGESGRFWLLWQVLWLSADDTHFFVHLMDQDEQFWGQQDSVGYPTAYRHKGDRILSVFDIKSEAETGTAAHWSRAGVYLYPQVVNVPVVDDAGNPVNDAVLMGPLDGGP